MRKKGHAVQRKKRAEDMDTFILNIGVGNDEGGRKEGRKGGSDSLGGFYTLVRLDIPIQRTAAGNTAELVKRPFAFVGGGNKAVSTAVSKIYFDVREGM